MRATIALVVTAAALSAALAPAAAARDCTSEVDFNVHITSARGMTCAAAARDLRRHKGSIATRFSTPGGFACHRISGSSLAGVWRCTKGTSRAYRFRFSD
jgi:hypothetical protein